MNSIFLVPGDLPLKLEFSRIAEVTWKECPVLMPEYRLAATGHLFIDN